MTQDRALRGLVERELARSDRSVAAFDYCEEILHAGQAEMPDLLLVDLSGVPQSYAFPCAQMEWPDWLEGTPRILVNDGLDPRQRYQCLLCGAAGYLQKPVEAGHLRSRVDHVLERGVDSTEAGAGGALHAGPIRLDPLSATVTIGSRAARLSASQTLVLRYFLERPNQLIGLADVLVGALGYPPAAADPAIARVQIWNLRRKIEADPSVPSLLVGGPEGGYVLAVGDGTVADSALSRPATSARVRPCLARSPGRSSRGPKSGLALASPTATESELGELVQLQHRDLIVRLARLEQALAGGRGRREIAVLLDFLGDYVLAHFWTEERLMSLHGYPRYAPHKLLHESFSADLAAARREILAEGVTTAMALAIHERLQDWLSSHINQEDRVFEEIMIKSRGGTIES